LVTLAVYLGALALGRVVVEARAVGIATMLAGQLALVIAQGGHATRTLFWVIAASAPTLLVVIYVPAVARAMDVATLAPAEFLGAAAVGAMAAFGLVPFDLLQRLLRARRVVSA
jgi:hypothetical protein